MASKDVAAGSAKDKTRHRLNDAAETEKEKTPIHTEKLETAVTAVF